VRQPLSPQVSHVIVTRGTLRSHQMSTQVWDYLIVPFSKSFRSMQFVQCIIFFYLLHGFFVSFWF
jgi:hypothetical protein